MAGDEDEGEGSRDGDLAGREPSQQTPPATGAEGRATSPGGDVGRTPPFGSPRVTLSFRGPPLRLPEDDATAGAPEDEPVEAAPALELDTSELDGEERTPAPLTLDLSGLDSKAGGRPSDGWTADAEEVHSLSSLPVLSVSELPEGLAEMFDDVRRSPRPGEARVMPPPVPPLPPLPRIVPPPVPTEDDAPAEPSNNAIDLVDRSHPSSPPLDLAGEMTERYALGDFTGALRVAELLLGQDPEDVRAKRCAQESREHLEQIYTSRLGSLDRVPTVQVPDSEIRWLGLDHRAGFLLSRIDGRNTLQEVLDVSGMPRLDALRTLVELLDAGTIGLG